MTTIPSGRESTSMNFGSRSRGAEQEAKIAKKAINRRFIFCRKLFTGFGYLYVVDGRAAEFVFLVRRGDEAEVDRLGQWQRGRAGLRPRHAIEGFVAHEFVARTHEFDPIGH